VAEKAFILLVNVFFSWRHAAVDAKLCGLRRQEDLSWLS
jgi:hypothetical protein